MKITIDLNKEGSIEAAIAKLDKARADMEQLAKEIVEELAKNGADIARVNFADAEYAGSHSEEVGFKISENGKTATVYADGKAVLFIEFGTGIYKQSPVREYGEIESGYVAPHGQYGLGNGANPYGWFYTGSPQENDPFDTERATNYETGYVHPNSMHTYGNDANSSMYRARLMLEKQYESIVRNVWGRRNGR